MLIRCFVTLTISETLKTVYFKLECPWSTGEDGGHRETSGISERLFLTGRLLRKWNKLKASVSILMNIVLQQTGKAKYLVPPLLPSFSHFWKKRAENPFHQKWSNNWLFRIIAKKNKRPTCSHFYVRNLCSDLWVKYLLVVHLFNANTCISCFWLTCLHGCYKFDYCCPSLYGCSSNVKWYHVYSLFASL